MCKYLVGGGRNTNLVVELHSTNFELLERHCEYMEHVERREAPVSPLLIPMGPLSLN